MSIFFRVPPWIVFSSTVLQANKRVRFIRSLFFPSHLLLYCSANHDIYSPHSSISFTACLSSICVNSKGEKNERENESDEHASKATATTYNHI